MITIESSSLLRLKAVASGEANVFLCTVHAHGHRDFSLAHTGTWLGDVLIEKTIQLEFAIETTVMPVSA